MRKSKSLIFGWLSVLVLILIMVSSFGCSQPAAVSDSSSDSAGDAGDNDESAAEMYNPMVIIEPSALVLNGNSTFVAMGIGFPPNEKVSVVTTDATGVFVERAYEWWAEDAEPMTDENGMFVVDTKVGRFARVAALGLQTITIKVGDVQVTVPRYFYAAEENSD